MTVRFSQDIGVLSTLYSFIITIGLLVINAKELKNNTCNGIRSIMLKALTQTDVKL